MCSIFIDYCPFLCVIGFCYRFIVQSVYLFQVLEEEMPVLNRSFIFLFSLLLFVPLILVDLSPDRISVQENRKLAGPPSFSDIKNHPGLFIGEFDIWFKDSTGFREQMLALYNGISKNKSFSGQTHYSDGQVLFTIGEEGHHYFADVNGKLIHKYQGKQFLSDKQLQTMAAKLDDVKTFLEHKGIPLVVMFCTDKETIYPEFYTKSIKRGPEPVQLDVITGYLQEHISVDIFNIRQALLAEKNNYLLYPISGNANALSHYNGIGAFFAYRELMKHITTYFPWVMPLELADIDISYDEKGVHSVSLKEKTYRYLGPSFFDNVSFIDDAFWGLAFNAAYENIDSDLPVILLLCTSYSGEDMAGKFIIQTFGRTIITHFKNMEHIEEYITRFKPDIVVFESTEYQLNMFADSIAGIPELP
jgi:hypothetical protein